MKYIKYKYKFNNYEIKSIKIDSSKTLVFFEIIKFEEKILKNSSKFFFIYKSF